MLGMLLFSYLADRSATTGAAGAGLLAGGFVGLAFLARPYTAALMAAPAGLYLLSSGTCRSGLALLWIIFGAVPPLVFLSWYDRAITGNALQMVTTWVDPTEGVGFDEGHTLALGAQLLLGHVIDFVQWTSPVLLPLFVLLAIVGARRRERLFYPYIFPVLAAGYVLYYSEGGNRYGPRYYVEAYPFVVLYVVAALCDGGGVILPPRWRRAALLLFLAGCVSALVTRPARAWQEHHVVSQQLDL